VLKDRRGNIAKRHGAVTTGERGTSAPEVRKI
jgi:hypothetical protein